VWLTPLPARILSNQIELLRVLAAAGRWYDLRLRPYRTVDDKIDGVVITFVDVTERKSMEEPLKSLVVEATDRSRNET
jgi:two-component system, chemotaxis family, CheB/CheR fusion protein